MSCFMASLHRWVLSLDAISGPMVDRSLSAMVWASSHLDEQRLHEDSHLDREQNDNMVECRDKV